MGRDLGEYRDFAHVQQLRGIKRTLMGPLAGPLAAWALHPPAGAVKGLVLNRFVVPAIAAQARPFARVLDNGLSFEGRTDDCLAQRVFLFGQWQPALTAFLRSRLQPGDTFVDVGASQGWFCLVASPLVGREGRVVAIEASPVLAEGLRKQLARNRLTNVRIVNEAVAAEEDTLSVDHGPSEHIGLTRVVPLKGGTTQVHARPLDDLLSEEEVARLRVLKMDIEGSEFAAVRGMRRLLGRLPPEAELVIEVGPERAAPGDVDELFEIIQGAGFRPFALPNYYRAADYLKPDVPASLPALAAPPVEETDVVFSRSPVVSLVR